jgi:hypothetical protein
VKTSILWRVFVTLSLVLGLASLANSLWAQADPATGLNGKGKKAYSIPISDKRIQFQVTLPSGYTATMRVQEGGMAKLLAFNAGFAYALVPVTRGVDNKSCDFSIFQLTQDKDGNESIKMLEHVLADLDGPGMPTKSEPALEIKLTGVTNPKSDTSATRKAQELDPEKLPIPRPPLSKKIVA